MRPAARSSVPTPTRSSTSRERMTNFAGFSIGDTVTVTGSGYTGIARFVGPVHFSAGTWLGIELKMPTGKNDGCVQGKRFFSCPPNCGLFIIYS